MWHFVRRGLQTNWWCSRKWGRIVFDFSCPITRAGHQIQIIGAANCGKIVKGDDGLSGQWECKKGGDHSRALEQCFCQPWRPLRRRKPAPPQYIASININCAVPVNLITFLADLTLCFALISTFTLSREIVFYWTKKNFVFKVHREENKLFASLKSDNNWFI